GRQRWLYEYGRHDRFLSSLYKSKRHMQRFEETDERAIYFCVFKILEQMESRSDQRSAGRKYFGRLGFQFRHLGNPYPTKDFRNKTRWYCRTDYTSRCQRAKSKRIPC